MKVIKLITDYLALIVLVVALVALIVPQTFTWIPTSSISWLLGIVMFGMSLTLKPADFKVVIVKPLPVIIGFVAQYTIMPAVAWLLCKVFALPTAIAIGVVLVGCCPGGTASNIITYLSKGDTALSICITSLSTICAPLLTPLLTWLLVGATVNVSVMAMMLSVAEVVLLPIVLGLVVKMYFGKWVDSCLAYMPAVSTLSVAIILGVVLSANASRVLASGWLILLVVMLHNALGFAFGFFAAKAAKLNQKQVNAVTIEVGMQNSSLASALATTNFAAYPLAAVPGAIFSVWHNFSGALIASILKRRVKD